MSFRPRLQLELTTPDFRDSNPSPGSSRNPILPLSQRFVTFVRNQSVPTMANDVSAAIRYFRDSVRTALNGRTFRLSLQLSTLQKTLSSSSGTSFPEDCGRRFSDAVEGFLARIQDNFLLEACLKYAEFEKHLPVLTEGSPFAIQIPTHEAVGAFFSKIMNIDEELGHKFLSSLSIMNGNADPSKADDELVEEILQTHNVRVFQEVAALIEASASFYILGDLDRCVEECQKVNESPSHLQDEIVDTLVKYISWIYPDAEGRSFQDGLRSELGQKRGFFTAAEYNAITGFVIHEEASTAQEGRQGTDAIEPSIPPMSTFVAPSSWSIPKRYRVTRPPRYAGVDGEQAFCRLYSLMKDVYFECESLENFTGLFRCPPNEQPESYTRINWIHDDGIVGLQCFIEALYRRDEYAIAQSVAKGKLSRIFLVDGEEKKLSSNPIYCWRDDRHAHTDKDREEEKRIRVFLDIIDDSLHPR